MRKALQIPTEHRPKATFILHSYWCNQAGKVPISAALQRLNNHLSVLIAAMGRTPIS